MMDKIERRIMHAIINLCHEIINTNIFIKKFPNDLYYKYCLEQQLDILEETINEKTKITI